MSDPDTSNCGYISMPVVPDPTGGKFIDVRNPAGTEPCIHVGMDSDILLAALPEDYLGRNTAKRTRA